MKLLMSSLMLHFTFLLLFVAPFDGIQISNIIWLAALSELCGILGQVQGKTRRYDGPMGKSDRCVCVWCTQFTLCGEW